MYVYVLILDIKSNKIKDHALTFILDFWSLKNWSYHPLVIVTHIWIIAVQFFIVFSISPAKTCLHVLITAELFSVEIKT